MNEYIPDEKTWSEQDLAAIRIIEEAEYEMEHRERPIEMLSMRFAHMNTQDSDVWATLGIARCNKYVRLFKLGKVTFTISQLRKSLDRRCQKYAFKQWKKQKRPNAEDWTLHLAISALKSLHIKTEAVEDKTINVWLDLFLSKAKESNKSPSYSKWGDFFKEEIYKNYFLAETQTDPNSDSDSGPQAKKQKTSS